MMTTHRPNWKESATARKKARVRAKQKVARDERDHKAESKRRDGHRCRFPLCGCRKLGLRLESSHGVHKGMGGDPKGLRSDVENLLTLCVHRHQDGAVSVTKGTLEPVPLDRAKGFSGPVKFLVDVEVLVRYALADGTVKRKANAATGFVEVARERTIGVLVPLEPWQWTLLVGLAELDA